MNGIWAPSLIDTISLEPWTIHAVQDARFRSDGGVAFPMVPRAVWEREVKLSADQTIPLRVGVLLLERPGVRIVIDTGLGERVVPREVRGFFGGLTSQGGLARALEELDWPPDSVTHVILTHLHVDHSGGLFDEEGRSRFPRADLVVARRELEYALAPHPLRGPVYDNRTAHLLEQHGSLKRLPYMPLEVVPGLETFPLGGHSPGMIGLRIEGTAGTLLHPADLVPTRAHRRPRWVLSYDQDPACVYEQRKRLLGRALGRGWLVFFSHDPEVFFGRIVPGGTVEALAVSSRGMAVT